MSEPTLTKPPGPTDTPFVNAHARQVNCGLKMTDEALQKFRDLNEQTRSKPQT